MGCWRRLRCSSGRWRVLAASWIGNVLVSRSCFRGAIGGLISFWVLAHHIDFRMRGYQIWEPTKNGWVYEERRAHSSVDSLPFARKIVEDGYPAPCEVFIPSEEGVGATSSSMGPRKARGNFGANRGTLRR